MKVNLFKNKKARSRILIGGILLAVALFLVVFVVAQTQYPEGHEQELQDELNQLESNLTASGYDWLVK